MRVFSTLIIPWWMFILYFQPGSIEALSDVKISFDDLRSSKFRHLTIHQNQGTVFIGTANRLYKLSADLKLLANVSSLTSGNTNLLINYKNSELISCGGNFSYWCSFYNLSGGISQLDFTHELVLGYEKKIFANTTTVAFIGNNNPGQNNDEMSNLYVAMSYSGNSVQDSSLFVKTWSKHDGVRRDVDDRTRNSEKFDTMHRNKYKVNYVYGFSSGKYDYILTTQQNSTEYESSYISKLIRICYNGDSLLQGYTEIPIECKFNNNQTYNFIQAATIGKPSLNIATSMNIEPDDDVLFGVFSKSQNEETLLNKLVNQGALCIYSLKAINEKFTENIQNCFKGEGYLGFDTTIPNQPCAKNNKNIDSNFCSSNVNTPLVGNMSITGYPSITFDQLPTAIASKTSENHNDVFIGTNIGSLKLIVVKNLTDVCAKADLPLKERSPVNSDLLFSPNQDYLYVMTEHNLTRLRVPQNSICSEYIDYNTCLQNSLSYCGWCGSTHKCTVRCDCFDNNFELWYSSDFRKSIQILGSNSLKFQIGTVETIQLNITALPKIRDHFLCYFVFSHNKNLSTQGSVDQASSIYNFVSCGIPEASKIPSLSKNGSHSNATLTISTSDIPDIVKINITYFDCKTFISCKACISSEFSCIWCPKEKKCTYEAITDCTKSNFIEFQSNMTISSDKKTAIEFPSMKSYDVCETTSNLKCLINIEGKTETKNVVMKNNDFYCENTTYTYAKNTSKMNATVSIMWKISNFTHILSKTSVIIYKCQLMANNCTSCLTLNTEYNCGWCRSSNSCEFQGDCDDQVLRHINTCTDSPPPSILSVSPLQGLCEDGTNVTIKGESLGCTFEDINQRIFVAGVACTPYREMYEPMKSITCVTDKSSALPGYEGPVVVYVNKKPVVSKQNFKFVDPKILEVSPNSGPIYGGTELTIKGENLDVGKLVQVFIGDILCTIFLLTSDVIKCVTNTSAEKNATVSMQFDKNVRNLTNNTFKYVRDKERDEKGFNIHPKGILSGGVTIFIHIAVPKPVQDLVFHLYKEGYVYESPCKIHNDSILNCSSPYIPGIPNDSIDVRYPRKMNFFIKDKFTNDSIPLSEQQASKFLLYPDPQFQYFLNSSVEIDEESFVIIKGKNIDNACQKNDIKVNVGNHTCDVISISPNQLICRLSKLSSSNLMDDSEQKYDFLAEHDKITVSIGASFSVIVPRESSFPDKNPNTEYIIYVIIAFIVFAILSITSIAFLWSISKKRAANHLKRMKKLQQQVNVMGMEAIATKQCMKRVIIKNQISLDRNSSKILKLPEVEIENTQIFRTNNGTSADSEYLLPLDDKWEFPKNNLTLGRCLGEGEFGKVIQGEAKNILKENITTTVAVKMLKDNHSDEDMIDLVSEMEIMKLIGTHANVLCLLGCCTKGGALFVITEYARHGNLREFLRKRLPSNCETSVIDLPKEKLIMFAIQVASGMEYLASIKCIHRDLAARNVLVSENYTLKIADFGLARDITNKEYYRKRTDGRLPVKWMAPESLCHSIYSTQSDVWSYGILLWEIFTLGGNPYPSLLDVGKLYQALRSGYRMEKPSNCSVKIYSLMHKCWSFRPSDRPSFSTVVNNLEDMLLSHKTLDLCNVYWPERDESNDLADESDHLFE